LRIFKCSNSNVSLFGLFLFKTAKTYPKLTLQQQLKAIPAIQKWTIDFEDCDKVLRIESSVNGLLPLVIKEINALGLFCEELG
jgi:hypothetical protein